MGTGIAIGSVVFTVLVIVFVLAMLKKSGAFGPSKAKREQAANLVATGHKGRAMILSIQPTGMVVNNINIQCRIHFRIEPLQGGAPFDGEKTTLIPQTSMPRIGEIWPCWFDPMDRTQFAVGQPNAITPEQVALFREFGIPHPLDPQAQQYQQQPYQQAYQQQPYQQQPYQQQPQFPQQQPYQQPQFPQQQQQWQPPSS
jgi:hypothetical protein